MLRRHVRRDATGGACAGFDADAASAYVEGALAASARARYEEHLAGCPSCRRGVVELSRQVPQEARLPVTGRAPARGTRAGIRRWLDLSAFVRWPWPVAAAGVAALLLAALLVPLLTLRDSGTQQVAQRSAPAAEIASPSQSPEVTPAPSPSARAEARADRPAGSAADAAAKVDVLRTTRQAAKESDKEAASAGEARLLDSHADRVRMTQLGPPPDTSRIAELRVGTAQPPPPPPAPAAAPAEEKKGTPNETSPAVRLVEPSPAAAGRAEGTSPPVRARLTPRAAAPKADAEAARPAPWRAQSLSRKVGNKTFFFERDTWVDSEYQYDAKLPVERFVRDSEEFERVLAAQPVLKQFFDLGQVRVVWRGRVYEVRK